MVPYAPVVCDNWLRRAEVIGFLGGTWDREKRVLTISRVFPGKSVKVIMRSWESHFPFKSMLISSLQCDTVASHVQCEMDPLMEVKLRADVEAGGVSVVGWYHSHPVFEPRPSQCDIDNQSNYQVRDARPGALCSCATACVVYNAGVVPRPRQLD